MTRIDHILRVLNRRRLAVARMRRLRERQKAGLSIAPAPYTDDIVALLLDTGWLPEADSEKREQVGIAMFRMLNEAAKAHRQQ